MMARNVVSLGTNDAFTKDGYRSTGKSFLRKQVPHTSLPA